MRFQDLVDPDALAAALDAKLINVRYADDGQAIYNYSDLAMFTPGAWDNSAVRQCRGLIVSADGETVVARPWEKFFNHNQSEAGELDFSAMVEVTDKKDGSLGIIHRASDGTLRVASRGSFESDQAKWATQWLIEHQASEAGIAGVDDFTYLVEIVYPENRIVCDYGDFEGLILLGAVRIKTGGYLGPGPARALSGWRYEVTETFEYETLKDALAAAPRPGAEGLCVRFLADNKIVKIKQEDYVALHKIVTGLSERSVWEHRSNGGCLHDLLASLPDELHDWTRQVWIDQTRQVEELREAAVQAHREIVLSLPRGFGRKEYAELASKSPYRAYLFMLLDDKDITDAIFKSIKPRGDSKAKTFSEATA